jgi:two-component system LytT family response regulator
MKLLQILILEDNIDDAQTIINLLSKEYVITLVNTLKKAKDIIASSQFDLAIIDINIDGKLNGIEFAKYIQNSTESIPFLFLTSMQSRMVFDQAKLTQPFTYLLKPFNDLELQYSIELAIEKYFLQKNTLLNVSKEKRVLLSSEFIFVKKKCSVKKVSISTINYIKFENKYCELISDDETYLIKLSLTCIKDILPKNSFKQIHRNYIVNIQKIKEIYFQDNLILLNNGDSIPISERYKTKFIKEHHVFR